MMFGQSRQELRQMYVTVWQKSQDGEILSGLEGQIAAVIGQHPEYHPMLQSELVDDAYIPEHGQTNPFLHMGLHLAIREQAGTDRPPGIAAIHQRLSQQYGDPHVAEHQMIECLAESLWEAQNRHQPPDEQHYIERLRTLLL